MSVEWESIRGCSELWFSVGWSAGEPDPSTLAVSRGAGGGRGGLRVALRSVGSGLHLGLASGPRFPDPVRADGRGNMDVRWTAVSRSCGGRAGEARAQWWSDTRLRLAKLFVAGGKRGSPVSTWGGKALKDLSASGVDNETLMARGPGADIGEIDSRAGA